MSLIVEGRNRARVLDQAFEWARPSRRAHIRAGDLYSAAFAQSYAMTRDHVCTLADQYVATRSEQSRYFGPGASDANLRTDFGWLGLGLREKAKCQLARMSEEARELVRATAAGYNHYLAVTDPAHLPRPCRGAEWVKPVSELDVAAYLLALLERGSGQALLGDVGTTQPPGPTSAGLMCVTPSEEEARALTDRARLGSNGWGIGADRSESGRGMLLINPHFPWQGELRFYELHLTVPGELDIHGATLVGTPTVTIGLNDRVAWTHTVSSASHFTIYALTLDPSDPTVYLYEGERRRMARHTATIMVKGEDGALSEVSRTLYQSHYGPVISVAPLLWSSAFALTFRDANINNTRAFDYWLTKDKATDLESFRQAYRSSGNPWVNTHEWVEDDEAAEPGLVPYRLMPQLERTDYVMNANDSHWLSNPDAPLEGYSRLYGSERSQRSPRARMNLIELQPGDETSGPDDRFSFEELKAIRSNGRAYLAEDWLDDVVERCGGAGEVELDGATVPIADACALLAAWDGRATLDSVGSALVHGSSGLTEDGYLVTYGSSFVVALEFTDDGVRADGLLTYSQSADPDSPHFADQTELFAQAGWRQIPLTEEALLADPNLVTERVSNHD